MEIESQREDRVLLLTVNAERIDAASAVQFKDQFREAVLPHPGRVLIDLRNVGFIDSSGLGALVAARKIVSDRALELANLSEIVSRVFRLTRMEQVFTIHEDLRAGLKKSGAAPSPEDV